jgi:hypothetical protein
MLRRPGITLFAALLFTGLVATPDAYAFGSSKMKGEVDLVRPSGGAAPTAKGKLKVEADTKKGTDKFEVHAIQIDPLLVHELWMEDPLLPGTFVFIAVMDSDGDDSAKYKVDTKKGDALPHGAADAVALGGLAVEVRPTGLAAVLEGEVPALGAKKKPVKAKLKMSLPGVPPAPDAQGKVEMRSKFDKGDHRIEVKAKKLPYDAVASFHLFIETAVEGVFAEVAVLVQKGSSEGRFRVRTKDGQALPLGIKGVDELEGRDVQIRGADLLTVYLEGVIPAMK